MRALVQPWMVEPSTSLAGALRGSLLGRPASLARSRVERLQRAGLPGGDLVGDGLGHVRDRLVGQFGAQRRGQVVLDVTNRHPARIQADDLILQSTGTALPVGHQPGHERAVPVPGPVQIDRAHLGIDGLPG